MSRAGIKTLQFDVFVASGRLSDEIGRSTEEQRSRPKVIEAEVVVRCPYPLPSQADSVSKTMMSRESPLISTPIRCTVRVDVRYLSA